MGKLNVETLAPSLPVVTLVLTESNHDDILVFGENLTKMVKFSVITMAIAVCQE